MSIKNFFKPVNPLPKSEGDEERPQKRPKVTEEGVELVSDVSAVDGKAGPQSPGTILSSQETPKKSDVKATEGNSTASTGLTSEQLEKIEQRRQAAVARQQVLEKSKSGAVSIVESLVLLEPTWKEVLGGEFEKEYFRRLDEFVTAERQCKTIFPPAHQTFQAFAHCPFDNVRVVIVGQDPYHGARQAHGLCFSVQKGEAIPPSLRNMYTELEQDPAIAFKRPPHGCLVKWAEQGVLMLNACLSVRKGEANAHAKRGWETFTDAVIAAVNRRKQGVVFLLWGKPAQDKCKAVDKKRHHVLTAVHPSPLSAHRGFFGCRHFSKCNELLEASGKDTIEWQL